MSASLTSFLVYLNDVEGPAGPVNPADPAGFTSWYGVIGADVQKYNLRHGTHYTVYNLDKTTAANIIGEQYWSASWDGQPAPSTISSSALAFVLADTAVNPITGIQARVDNIMARGDLTDDQKALWIINARSELYASEAKQVFQSGLQNRLTALRNAIAPFLAAAHPPPTPQVHKGA